MTTWKLDGTRFQQSDDTFGFHGDLAQPSQGVFQTNRTGKQALAGLFAFSDPHGASLPALDDWYVRGEDLIANYPQSDASRFGWHLELATFKHCDLTVLQVIVTVQTDLLDCHPMMDVCFRGRCLKRLAMSERDDPIAATPPSMQIPASQNCAAPIAILKLDQGYATVMMPPRDWPVTGFHLHPERTAETGKSDERIEWRLFEEFLEKGVIRKARLWICLAPQEPQDAEAREVYASLCHVPLPLTA